MIDIPSNGSDLKLLTPKGALEYLQNKKQYLATWKQLIPNYFSAEDFCKIINTIRFKRIEITEKRKEITQKINDEIATLKQKKKEKKITPTELGRMKMLQEQKNNVFPELLKAIFNTDIGPRIKNADIDYREVNQLIGSLINVARPTKEKIEEVTEGANEELHEDLSMDPYEDEILLTMDELIYEFFTKKGTGSSISEGEKKEFGQQAWGIFLMNHKEDVDNGTIDTKKLIIHLHNKKVI